MGRSKCLTRFYLGQAFQQLGLTMFDVRLLFQALHHKYKIMSFTFLRSLRARFSLNKNNRA